MIGSVLEGHMRQLCQKYDIPVKVEKDGKLIPEKADKLNHSLVKAEVYNKLDMKQVTAWLDLRNKAAHGNYNEYENDQVNLMLKGVMDFVARFQI
jgi:hypothetical protein